jgi:catechol-2,3-dioxygenase
LWLLLIIPSLNKEYVMSVAFDHVSLRVTDLERSITFYRDTLELDFVSRNDQGTQSVFRVGDALLVLFCRDRYQSVPDDTTFGTDHVAFCLDGDLYSRVLDRLKREDLVSRGPTRNKGARGEGVATYFNDPDGNELEIKTYEEVATE